MNPASQGLMVALVVLFALILIILALVAIKQYFPGTKAAAVAGEIETDASKLAAAARSDIRQAETKVTPLFTKIEIGVGNELASMLTKVEAKLLDTSGEDALIAEAQQYLARVVAETDAKIMAANAAKQAKLAATQSHIATLTAAVVPVTGS